MNRPSLGIVSTVHQTADTGMNQRSRTHYARFNCSKQLAVAQTMVTDVSSRFAQGHHFGMGGRIIVSQVAVPAAPHNAALTNYNCSDGYFAGLECPLRRAESFFHPQLVRSDLVRRRHFACYQWPFAGKPEADFRKECT